MAGTRAEGARPARGSILPEGWRHPIKGFRSALGAKPGEGSGKISAAFRELAAKRAGNEAQRALALPVQAAPSVDEIIAGVRRDLPTPAASSNNGEPTRPTGIVRTDSTDPELVAFVDAVNVEAGVGQQPALTPAPAERPGEVRVLGESSKDLVAAVANINADAAAAGAKPIEPTSPSDTFKADREDPRVVAYVEHLNAEAAQPEQVAKGEEGAMDSLAALVAAGDPGKHHTTEATGLDPVGQAEPEVAPAIDPTAGSQGIDGRAVDGSETIAGDGGGYDHDHTAYPDPILRGETGGRDIDVRRHRPRGVLRAGKKPTVSKESVWKRWSEGEATPGTPADKIRHRRWILGKDNYVLAPEKPKTGLARAKRWGKSGVTLVALVGVGAGAAGVAARAVVDRHDQSSTNNTWRWIGAKPKPVDVGVTIKHHKEPRTNTEAQNPLESVYAKGRLVDWKSTREQVIEATGRTTHINGRTNFTERLNEYLLRNENVVLTQDAINYMNANWAKDKALKDMAFQVNTRSSDLSAAEVDELNAKVFVEAQKWLNEHAKDIQKSKEDAAKKSALQWFKDKLSSLTKKAQATTGDGDPGDRVVMTEGMAKARADADNNPRVLKARAEAAAETRRGNR